MASLKVVMMSFLSVDNLDGTSDVAKDWSLVDDWVVNSVDETVVEKAASMEPSWAE